MIHRLILVLLLAPAVSRADCVAEGVALARTDLDAARAALRSAADRAECRDDPLLHYNLGFVRHELARRDADPTEACEAARAYRRFIDLNRSGDATEMTRDRLADADRRCRPEVLPAPVAVEVVEPGAPSEAFPWRWTALGLTVAATATAVVSGGLALSEASQARDAETRLEHDDHSDAADSFSGVSDIAWAVAGAGAAATIALWVWGPDDAVSVRLTPGAAFVGGRF